MPGNRFSRLNTSIGLWGAHSQNLLHQSATDNGSADIAIQNAYQRKLELTFSGGNRNPAATPEIGNGEPLANEALKKFHGLAALLTAKKRHQHHAFRVAFQPRQRPKV